MCVLLIKMSTFYAVNIYPHVTILQNGFPLEFAFFDNNSTFSIEDGPHVYTNVFDFVYDSFVSALRKYGFDKDAKVKATNRTFLILQQFERACDKNDCSRLYYGASYSNLTFEGNIS